jgi:hypothetical protein
MEIKELKFLLKLVGRENYEGKISDLKPNSQTKISETESICRKLRDRELVACNEEINKIKIHSAGKVLLKLDTNNLPVSADELKILKACATEAITPSKTNVTPAQKRQELIASLIERGLITAASKKIERVWITPKGKEMLAEEYFPKGTSSVLSLDLLKNYLCFLRKYLRSTEITTNGQANNGNQPQITANEQASNAHKPSDEEILQTIIDLDHELGTGNYLPIFHLRDKLQPSLSRTELDEALYRLQRQDKLELSSLVEAVRYTKEQIQAGIPQDVGGYLFFLIVN